MGTLPRDYSARQQDAHSASSNALCLRIVSRRSLGAGATLHASGRCRRGRLSTTDRKRPGMFTFAFATGIESSAPTVNGVRVDQMEKCRFYEHWRTDFRLVLD